MSFCVASVAIYTPVPTLHFKLTLYTRHSTLYTPHFTLRTLYSTLYTPHFTLHTLHSALHIPHSTLHTLHTSLHTPHSALHTLHSTLHTFHCILHTLNTSLHSPLYTVPLHSHSTVYTLHSTIYTPHFLYSTFHTLHTLHTLHSRSTLHTLHFTLHTPHFTLYISHFTLYTPHSTLHTPHSTLHTLNSHSTLSTLHSTLTLYTPHFTLHIPHFTLDTPHLYLILLAFTSLHTFPLTWSATWVRWFLMDGTVRFPKIHAGWYRTRRPTLQGAILRSWSFWILWLNHWLNHWLFNKSWRYSGSSWFYGEKNIDVWCLYDSFTLWLNLRELWYGPDHMRSSKNEEIFRCSQKVTNKNPGGDLSSCGSLCGIHCGKPVTNGHNRT